MDTPHRKITLTLSLFEFAQNGMGKCKNVFSKYFVFLVARKPIIRYCLTALAGNPPAGRIRMRAGRNAPRQRLLYAQTLLIAARLFAERNADGRKYPPQYEMLTIEQTRENHPGEIF